MAQVATSLTAQRNHPKSRRSKGKTQTSRSCLYIGHRSLTKESGKKEEKGTIKTKKKKKKKVIKPIKFTQKKRRCS